ncbi:MAG: hypothetical protein V5B36_00940 [Candidatus Accumulibacter sp. UW25]|jgi:hypothetical protein
MDTNRRAVDIEIEQLVFRVTKLEQDFFDFEKLCEVQKNVNLSTHTELVKSIVTIKEELSHHTKAEELKFDLIITKLDKLVADTAPAVAITTAGKYLAIFVKVVKDTIVPIIVGSIILYGIVHDYITINSSAINTHKQTEAK